MYTKITRSTANLQQYHYVSTAAACQETTQKKVKSILTTNNSLRTR